MNKIFPEFENENSMRTYPFASGMTCKDTSGNGIPVNVLVDAALYPVNPKGNLYLSRISAGEFSISDQRGVVMTATLEQGSDILEFHDTSDLHRHVGTMVASSPEALASLANAYEERRFRQSETEFASSCVFPVVNDGVTSINVGGTGMADGLIEFVNGDEDAIRVSSKRDLALNRRFLRFDVVPLPETQKMTSIQHIFCVVDGKTPFRIMKIPFYTGESGNCVAVYLDNIDRSMICSNAHREDALEMKDTCDCGSSESGEDEETVEIPHTYQTAVVDIPNEADSAFYLTVPNMLGYDNPLSITLTDGATTPKSSAGITVSADGDNLEQLMDMITSKGAIIQVPGLAAQ